MNQVCFLCVGFLVFRACACITLCNSASDRGIFSTPSPSRVQLWVFNSGIWTWIMSSYNRSIICGFRWWFSDLAVFTIWWHKPGDCLVTARQPPVSRQKCARPSQLARICWPSLGEIKDFRLHGRVWLALKCWKFILWAWKGATQTGNYSL